ncbi:MAG TPA: autotransporter-associated beta strand repeat-containing protein, partial [Verrucomicrobiales bacterium]|nr:autotransporter-associated beta strand repeat-containing protein [Verrucomicrobiales bacterium]
ANTYTGTTTVNAGTLELSGGAAIIDTGAVVMANVSGANLKLNNDETIGSLAGGGTTGGDVNLQGNTLTVGDATPTTTFAGVISGTSTGNFMKEGAGTMILSGDNTYDGTTTVNDGALYINGDQSAANGAVSVANSSTLGGAGTVGGNTTIASGGTITGGTNGGIGTLTFTGNLTAATGSIWLVDLVQNANGNSDSITVGGNLAIAGAIFQDAFTNAFTMGNKYTIATYSGVQSGVFDYSGAWNDNTERTIGGGQYLIKYADAGAITLTAVPEPGTLGFLAMALGGFFFRRIRKRRAEAAMVAAAERR